MALAHNSQPTLPAERTRGADDSVQAVTTGKTRSDLEIPDPLAAAADAEYGQRLARLLGELQADLGRLSAPKSVSEFPAQLAFVTGWVSRVAGCVVDSPSSGPIVTEALAAAEQCVIEAKELMPVTGGWKSWLGLSGTPKPVRGSHQIRAIKASVEVLAQLFVAFATGFQSPERAAGWIATVGQFSHESRRVLAWANSTSK